MAASFTAQDKRDSAIREANMRRRVYPRWVENGKMRQASADREIALMEAIAEDYKLEAEKEAVERSRADEAARQRTLFG
ncbi:hypothetical protein [Sandarakinorhabdus sp. DWP1-3-1]|uniref:hypothetical protein n=1 Tax=Sandarakinorhabdus sp. DWP1-3-1 TaxID=2804627 RepID=UPI003CFA3B67